MQIYTSSIGGIIATEMTRYHKYRSHDQDSSGDWLIHLTGVDMRDFASLYLSFSKYCFFFTEQVRKIVCLVNFFLIIEI